MTDKKKKWWVSPLLTLIGILFCVIPPAIAIIEQFPELIGDQKKLISGIALVLMIIAAYPLIKFGKKLLRSPSAWSVWLIVFVLFTALGNIAEQVKVVSLIGFISGLAGAVFFFLAGRYKKKDTVDDLKELLKE